MDENKNDKTYRNLVILLKMFKNRPHHLAKFLLDNNSFNKRFLDKVLTSNNLNDLSAEELCTQCKLTIVLNNEAKIDSEIELKRWNIE